MGQPIDEVEILDDLGPVRERILKVLFRHGVLGAGDLRQMAGVKPGAKEHHFAWLADGDEKREIEGRHLIEIVGHDASGGGRPEREFGLTDAGEAFTEKHLTDTDERPDGYAMKIDRALDEIDELKTTTERLRGTIKEQSDTIREQQREIERLQSNKVSVEWKEDLKDRLSGPYRESVIESAVERMRKSE